MTLRALKVLRECHRIYCEDTRNTGAMLSRLGISKPLISCHEHNEEGRAEEIAGRVAEGEAIAFVSDAGLPGISDPGERLVAAFIQRGLPFEVLPGPSASLTALGAERPARQGSLFRGLFAPHPARSAGRRWPALPGTGVR